MTNSYVFYAILLMTRTSLAAVSNQQCRCIPTEPCWPSDPEWHVFNSSISGQLIQDYPIAEPCYPGLAYNKTTCVTITNEYANTTFQENNAIGYVYPLFAPCPPVNVSAGETPKRCSLGNAPVYTVNATTPEQVAAGIAFAKQHNIRLVIRDTGHDLLGRSAGYGSLQIWIRYLRTGIIFHEKYIPASGSPASGWTGSAFTIGGGYVWSDVYPEANKRNLVVVGGGTPSVGCLGGWMQGGGHSPATHNYGLGADQVLEAQVVTANGSLVSASPSSNPDLFYAIRGGGPGSYGIVVSTTVKAWPSQNMVAQTLAFAPLSSHQKDINAFFEAIVELYTAFPTLSKGGFSGYGTWSTASALPIFGNFTVGYAHTIATMGMSLSQSQAVFQPVLKKLKKYNNTSLFISLTYTKETSYAAYYNTFSGSEPPSGTLGARGSRFLDKAALTANRTELLETLREIAGTPDEMTSNNIVFVGGGQVARDATEIPLSAVNPAWRSMVVHHIVARGYNQTTSAAEVQAIRDDITYNKVHALKRLAPSTGCYMNEADLYDPEWQQDFYGMGGEYEKLLSIKQQLDPDGDFYCPTCVGSEQWMERKSGQLCRVN